MNQTYTLAELMVPALKAANPGMVTQALSSRIRFSKIATTKDSLVVRMGSIDASATSRKFRIVQAKKHSFLDWFLIFEGLG